MDGWRISTVQVLNDGKGEEREKGLNLELNVIGV